MPKFIKLTLKNDTPVHILADHVIAVQVNDDRLKGVGTRITPSTGFTFAVKETVDEVLALIDKTLGRPRAVRVIPPAAE